MAKKAESTAKGALTGAAIGAPFGPWGAGIGALAGGGLGFLAGSSAEKEEAAARKSLEKRSAEARQRAQKFLDAYYGYQPMQAPQIGELMFEGDVPAGPAAAPMPVTGGWGPEWAPRYGRVPGEPFPGDVQAPRTAGALPERQAPMPVGPEGVRGQPIAFPVGPGGIVQDDDPVERFIAKLSAPRQTSGREGFLSALGGGGR